MALNRTTSAICTLFEGSYHVGVATLINSVSKHGFKGSVFVGYKGSLPEWCSVATSDASLGWVGAKTLILNANLSVHFLPVTVSYQLTNYKPVFMLELFAGPCLDVDQIAYFDPDIVVKSRWDFFKTWMTHGVALVHEIVNNDMPPTHPIRMEWAKVASLCNRTVERDLSSYINAGFFGVSKNCIDFLELFRDIIEVAKKNYHFEDSVFQMNTDRSDIFYAHDQDALNIAAMCCRCPISEMGPEAMDFTNGGFTMAHAVGSPKPWAKKFISSALKGIPPTMAEKVFWENVSGPITIYTASRIRITSISIKIAGFIGRFYKRN
ncbi:MAG: hypothetical protein WKF66_19330 [Pedobacter sp.]